LAHIGVLQVVDTLALPVDLVVGVSMGGVIAASYAAGLSPDQMVELARAMRVGSIFRPRPGRLQLVDGSGIRAAITRMFGDLRFADLQRELVIVSSSVTSGEHYVIRDGSLVDALVASCSIPLVFPPVTVDGHHLVDGGMIDGMPIAVAHNLGARRIVAVDASTNARKVLGLPVVRHAARGVVTILGRRERRRPADVLDAVRIFTQVLDRATQPLTRPPVELLIRPPFGRLSMFDYHRWLAMIACGRVAGEAARPMLEALAGAPRAAP
jgi:predicted acylesterase/phospholipase RssA